MGIKVPHTSNKCGNDTLKKYLNKLIIGFLASFPPPLIGGPPLLVVVGEEMPIGDRANP